MYVRGFTENHPKVAWALEGIAKARPRRDLGAISARSRHGLGVTSPQVHHQRGDLRQSAMFFEKAIALRKQIQACAANRSPPHLCRNSQHLANLGLWQR